MYSFLITYYLFHTIMDNIDIKCVDTVEIKNINNDGYGESYWINNLVWACSLDQCLSIFS
jgi:hypothetical protein